MWGFVRANVAEYDIAEVCQRLAIVALELAFWLSLGSEHIASRRQAQ